MNGYELSRAWFDFSFENPEKIKPIQSAIYFFAIEHCNRLGWKENFGLPSQMVMEAIGVKNWKTYSAALKELVEIGFIKMIEVSKNQFSSNIVALVNFTKATTEAQPKALDKALSKHSTKQRQSTVSIDKQLTIEPINQEQSIVVPQPPHPLITWIQTNTPKVQKLKQPLTNDECTKLLEDLKIDTDIKKVRLKDMLTNMQNYKPLLTKNESANLTIRNWWKREMERETPNQPLNTIKMNDKPYTR
jgi:hypothetical protein